MRLYIKLAFLKYIFIFSENFLEIKILESLYNLKAKRIEVKNNAKIAIGNFNW